VEKTLTLERLADTAIFEQEEKRTKTLKLVNNRVHGVKSALEFEGEWINSQSKQSQAQDPLLHEDTTMRGRARPV
jgi:hypothetical protein